MQTKPAVLSAQLGRPQWRAPARRRDDSDSEDEEDEEAGASYSIEEYGDSDDFESDTTMRLYLDTADVAQWTKWAEAGVFYGFTTNPTILRRDAVPCTIASMRHLAREAFALEVEELQLQAWGPTAGDMYACAMDLADLDSRIIVKLPITLEGAKAARKLIKQGAPVTMTGVYASHQVVTALAMGAAYAAPYVGGMTDSGINGLKEAIKMQEIIDQSSEGAMRLLVASVRSADDMATLAEGGCNTFTISPAVAQQLFDVQLTQDAADVFQRHATEMADS
ncbi:hypothetical protein D9Q98_000470 [Chlorella vulgaris]|uniref:Transaldolase n=1 Tax=Chlorella vulgaris TaxID=3077 RepID=A0A9D4TYE0_CHLVU|nr:hypothetical protein D9Q98_000470 [Chlorella vulgaris]